MRPMRIARGTIVLAAAGLGALFAAGSLLAIMFELQGFGAPRDADPRLGYLLLLALGLAASIGLPLALRRLLLPDTAPRTAVIAGIALGALGVSLLGVVSLR